MNMDGQFKLCWNIIHFSFDLTYHGIVNITELTKLKKI
jgi:hypothetical protein